MKLTSAQGNPPRVLSGRGAAPARLDDSRVAATACGAVCEHGVMSPLKVPSIAAALALAAVALVGCAAAVTPEAAGTTRQTVDDAAVAHAPAATHTPESTEPGACSRMSQVFTYGDDWRLEREGSLRDLGAREFAQGKVTADAAGTPETYTVEPGDVEAVIAERLCAYPNLGSMNHVRTIQPGQVLWLNPNPETPWVPFHSPADAGAGFQQIPYQEAIQAAGAAVDAGDVDDVRAIWNDTLSGMFTNQGTIDAVQQVVDSGDLDALRQLFS